MIMAIHGWKGFGIDPHMAEKQPHKVNTLGLNHPVDYSTADPFTERGGNSFDPSLPTLFMNAFMYNVNIFLLILFVKSEP